MSLNGFQLIEYERTGEKTSRHKQHANTVDHSIFFLVFQLAVLGPVRNAYESTSCVKYKYAKIHEQGPPQAMVVFLHNLVKV